MQLITYVMIANHSSDSVERADATYSVMEIVNLENFLASKNLTFSDRLQEAQYNSVEGFKKV